MVEIKQVEHTKIPVGKFIEMLKQFSYEDAIDLRGVIHIERSDIEPCISKDITIRINRELTHIPDDVCEYDDNGYLIYRKHYECKEEWIDYDENGNIIHRKDSDGFEEWLEYNDKNQCIHSYTEKIENTYEYDESGKCIKAVTSCLPKGKFYVLRNKDNNCI
jgi:hypothetical protein